MFRNELDLKLRRHDLWLYTDGINGERLDFRGVNIKDYNIIGKNLSKGKCDGMEIGSIKIVDSFFEYTCIIGSKFIGCDIINVTFDYSIIKYSEFINTNFIDVNFDFCDLTGTTFHYCNFKGVSAKHTNMLKKHYRKYKKYFV